MTCYSIHKRKNVKRLDKKDRLVREAKVKMAVQQQEASGNSGPEEDVSLDQQQQNPFKPIVHMTRDHQPQQLPQMRQGDKYLAIARS